MKPTKPKPRTRRKPNRNRNWYIRIPFRISVGIQPTIWHAMRLNDLRGVPVLIDFGAIGCVIVRNWLDGDWVVAEAWRELREAFEAFEVFTKSEPRRKEVSSVGTFA